MGIERRFAFSMQARRLFGDDARMWLVHTGLVGDWGRRALFFENGASPRDPTQGTAVP